MNYGKQKASKKQRDIASKEKMKKKRTGVRLFKGFLICLLVIGVIGVAGGAFFLKKVIDDSPKITPDSVKPSKLASFVLAGDGVTEIDRYVAAGSNRVNKSIDDIPKHMQDAFVAIEDERFYEHNGIDLQGIVRAGVIGITTGNFSQGASTITQQLIKNTIFPNFVEEKTFFDSVERKLQEQYLAVKLEKQMDKVTILEYYMNTINLGQNTLGAQAASQRYFGKDVNDLTLSESATIAAITQNPGGNNPITNPEKNAKRRTKVLDDMKKQGYITQEAYDEAMADPVYDRIQAVNTAYIEDTQPSTYFVDALTKQLIDVLKSELGLDDAKAHNMLYSGGLTIYSTQDLAIQQICDEEVNTDKNYPRKIEYGLTYALTITRADGTIENYDHNHIKKYALETYGDKQGLVYSTLEKAQAMIDEYKSTLNIQEGDTVIDKASFPPQPQSSVVVMDQYSGQVKAIVGGRGAKTESLSLNRATASPRQPGSCFKVLAAYAPALDSAGKTLATPIKDEPFKYQNGTPVKNWWGNYYKGNISVRSAIEQSANICAVKMLTEITPELGFEYLKKFGFTTIVDREERAGGVYTDIQQATALGGITHGVYNIEMTAAYAAIANNGLYNKPLLFTKILDHEGNILIDYSQNPGAQQILKDSTAGLLTNAMQDVITGSAGTGKMARLSNMPVSGKTGTTSNDIDIWFSAYTPYYTCSVWGGYDDNKELTNTTFHLTLWKSIMERIHSGLEYKEFQMPDSVEKMTVCTKTGKKASNGCPAVTEFFAKDSVPNEYCPGHYTEKKPSNSGNSNNSGTSNGGSETPPAGGGTETPPAGGGTETPPAGGGTETPPAGGGETPPAGGGETPPEGGTETPPEGGGGEATQ